MMSVVCENGWSFSNLIVIYRGDEGSAIASPISKFPLWKPQCVIIFHLCFHVKSAKARKEPTF
jgi:hypothetical protein